MKDCLFCKIIAKQIPSRMVYEDGALVAFHDIAPQATIHVLIVPKVHIATVQDLQEGDAGLIGQLILGAKKIAQSLQLAERGYRLVLNCNQDGCQSVFHLHIHLLGGEPLGGNMTGLANR